MKRSPILVMYNALMSVGVLSSPSRNDYRTPEWRLVAIDRIVNAALTEMNGEHTSEVQRVLAMTDKKRKAKRL